MKRWVVIANCQAFGIANSIRSLAKDVECGPYDLWAYMARIREEPEYFRENYDFAIISDEAPQWHPFSAEQMPPHIVIPNLVFSAFHPDCCYVHVNGRPLEGVVGPYQSLIAVAAYYEKVPPDKSTLFFNDRVFEQAGYFDLWEAQRKRLVSDFGKSGIEIGSALRRLSHGRSFMFTINHPKIDLLFEISKAILQARGERMHEGSWPPPETLAATQWPIYPQVGQRLGLQGGYAFKPANEHKPIDLDAFLALSHSAFSAWDASHFVVDTEIRPRLEQVRTMMREWL